jgi:aspartyl-tRNA(Asn)/glutamyl-tRNA(Gln) amidotransferase subunit C
MPSAISRTEVEAIAALAHLELQDDEIELFARQLGDILEYARQVQTIDTTGVEPTASVVPGLDVERGDDEQPSLNPQEALANAPDPASEAGLFKVPRVLG